MVSAVPLSYLNAIRPIGPREYCIFPKKNSRDLKVDG